jgi:hypothetical protein
VATMLVLLPGNARDPAFGPESAGRLARLGVTRVVVLRDDTTVGVVLEGWAFNTTRDGEQAVALVGPEGHTQALQSVAEISVSPETVDQRP